MRSYDVFSKAFKLQKVKYLQIFAQNRVTNLKVARKKLHGKGKLAAQYTKSPKNMSKKFRRAVQQKAIMKIIVYFCFIVKAHKSSM